MGRRFTAASNERIYFGAAGLAGLNFTFGTFACVVNFASFPSAATLLATNDQTNPSFTLYCASPSTQLFMYDGVNNPSGMSGLATGVTYLIGSTKASGTQTPRYHVYRADTNTWTHGAFSTTVVDGATSTSVAIGSYANSNATDALDAEMFAVGVWQGYVMSDREFECLASGRWLDLGPDFYDEYTGANEVGDTMTTLGRCKSKQTARTGTTRGTTKRPAGFRFAIQRRRR